MLSKKQSNNALTETHYDNQPLIDRIRDSENHLTEQVAKIKQKLKVIENDKASANNKFTESNKVIENKKVNETKQHEQKNALQHPDDLINYNEVTVTRLLAKRFNQHFNHDNYQKSIYELQRALLTLSGLLVVVSLGWLFISNTNFMAHGDFAYNAGLLGGFLMLCSLFYALMKRLRFINALGHNETWYYAHLICGIIGPVLIILHTSFQVKSINSAVSFTTMFVIMLSGLFGRYIFTMLSYKTQRIYHRVGEMELKLLQNLAQHQSGATKPVKSSLTRLVVSGLKKPKYWHQNIPQLFKVPFYAVSHYMILRRELRQIFIAIGKRRSWDKSTLKNNMRSNKRLARRYVFSIFKLSAMSMIQNMLHNWRMIHANLLYLLTLTASAHIVAVHMY